MLWVDKINKRCRSAEDWNFFPGEDGYNMKYRELELADRKPVSAIGAYSRNIYWQKDKYYGRFYVVGMGLMSTKKSGGFRSTYPNSYN
jgi:hypothetical protein